mmetsp:Transcript_22033/g.70977  ORF Transcript_22033/g.70977 Transcript_22033/m.70977 type:complete len:301 (+) Transcript_22033:504-1406(+)
MSLFREESATLSDREITKTARPPCEPTSNQRESDLVLAALASEEVGRLQLRQLWKPLEGGAAAENGVDEGAHRARLEPSLAAALARATAALQRGEAPPPPGLDGDEGGERGLLQPKGGEEVCLPLGAHAAKRDGVVAVPPRQSTDLGGTALAARLQEQRHDAERLGLDSVAKQRQALVCELVECHRRRLLTPLSFMTRQLSLPRRDSPPPPPCEAGPAPGRRAPVAGPAPRPLHSPPPPPSSAARGTAPRLRPPARSGSGAPCPTRRQRWLRRAAPPRCQIVRPRELRPSQPPRRRRRRS